MGLFLFRFWPVLIPIVIYVIWLYRVGRKATIEGRPVLRFREGPWYWAVLASLLIGIGCFLVLASTIESEKGAYTPSHMEGNKLVPGHIGNAP